jgi:hypothetical protein
VLGWGALYFYLAIKYSFICVKEKMKEKKEKVCSPGACPVVHARVVVHYFFLLSAMVNLVSAVCAKKNKMRPRKGR